MNVSQGAEAKIRSRPAHAREFAAFGGSEHTAQGSQHAENQAASRKQMLNLLAALVPVIAVLLWIFSLRRANPLDMGAMGLLDLFAPLTVVALLLLLGGFICCLYWRRAEWVLSTHLVAYVFLIHGTPPVLYESLRYAWAYKHVGIVDYIMRNSAVNPSIDSGDIYHNWPGFFAGGALLTEFTGQADALQIASWAPVAFNLLNLLVLRFVFRGLTKNQVTIWLGLMFFLLINWVGQDYYSPQAMAFVLYLGLIGLMLRPMKKRLMILPFIVIVTAIALSHQITPMMMMLSVLALVVLRRTKGWYLPAVAVLITCGWALTAALTYTLPNLLDLLTELGNVVGNTEDTLQKSSGMTSISELQVVWGGRLTVVISVFVAFLGIWRHRVVDGLLFTAGTLMVLPGVLVLTTGFGGEVLFRAFLFASPFIALLAAQACVPRGQKRLSRQAGVLAFCVALLVLPGFLLGYYGKEQQNYFSPTEVSAAHWVYTNAPPGSLLVEGSTNYPGRFIDYEKFTYVPLDREPENSRKVLLSDPAVKLAGWFTDPRYSDAFVILTRSQAIAVDSGTAMPPGSLAKIEKSLRESPQFEVAHETKDAIIFTGTDKERTK